MIDLSKAEARKYLLRYQHLYKPRLLSTDDEIVRLIKKIGCVQFDPLNKIAKNADLVLQSRCRGYTEQTLFHLLYEKRELIDGWDKNMAIWAVEDWPYFARRREHYRKRYTQHANEFGPVRREIIAKLKKTDCISSSDVESQQKVDWSWSPTKIGRAVLEGMYHSGELVIHHKEGVRKYYGVAGNLIPESVLGRPDPNKLEIDFNDWAAKRRIGGIGMLWNRSGDGWLGTNLKKEARSASIRRLMERDEIAELKIAGIDEIFYMPKGGVPLLDDTSVSHEASIIAALDNLIWDRKLISQLFGFDYKWEVYTPEKERKYAYYVLPIIYGDKFIARFEPVFNRKSRELMIHNWWWEKDAPAPQKMEKALIRCFRSFCNFLGAEKISIPDSLSRKGLKWVSDCA